MISSCYGVTDINERRKKMSKEIRREVASGWTMLGLFFVADVVLALILIASLLAMQVSYGSCFVRPGIAFCAGAFVWIFCIAAE